MSIGTRIDFGTFDAGPLLRIRLSKFRAKLDSASGLPFSALTMIGRGLIAKQGLQAVRAGLQMRWGELVRDIAGLLAVVWLRRLSQQQQCTFPIALTQ
jgi:hypothetical protein